MVNNHMKCMQHSLHNHGCTCPTVQRYTNEQNKNIRSLYTKLKFSSPERKAVRSMMYGKTAQIKTEAQALKVYDEVIEYITMQIAAQEAREASGPFEPNSTSRKDNENNKKRKSKRTAALYSDSDNETIESHANALSLLGDSALELVADSDESSDDDHPSKKRKTKKTKSTKSKRSLSPEMLEKQKVDDTPPPPPLREHIESMFSNNIQSMHIIWILKANGKGIITDTEADKLQFLPYNNQYPFFIVTVFLALYESLKMPNIHEAIKKWKDDGETLFQEVVDLIERRKV
ncbi:phosphoribosylformylglycinamidine synthase [Acrasis kona]|uniref:Phosphoribosylformylglycinamidine synthase n=1 Tax=Acrasis kona TaxID=1008807 RepID=A0AAW2YY47_9EUKA